MQQTVQPSSKAAVGPPEPRDPAHPWRGVWALVAVAALAYGLGDYALIDPDEGRSAEVAREMMVSGRYLLPTLDGVPYLDKPFLYFAACAGVMRIAGLSEMAARSGSLVFSIATVFLTAWFAGRLFGRRATWVAAIAAATAPLAIAHARAVIPDAMLSLFVTLSVMAFYFAVEARRQPSSGRRRGVSLGWTAVAWTAVALGILTKGPVALILPLLVAAPYAAWRRASTAIWHPVALVPLVVLVGPFLWLIAREFPGFLRYVLLVESLDRFAGSGLGRTQPPWFLVAVFCVGLFPWWILAVGGMRRRANGTRDPRLVFGLLWLLLPLIFFSLSKSKMPQYLLPLVPAAALLTAGWWIAPRPRSVRVAAALWSAFGALMLVASRAPLPSSEKVAPEVAGAIPGTVLALGCVAIAGALLAWMAARARSQDLAVVALSLPCLLTIVVTLPITRIIAEERSSRRLADQLAPLLTEETDLLGVEVYVPSLSFYLQREIPFVSQDGRQLRSNYVLRNYDSLVGPRSSIRPHGELHRVLAGCERTTVFLTSSSYSDLVELIEGGRAHLVARHHELLGFLRPCPKS